MNRRNLVITTILIIAFLLTACAPVSRLPESTSVSTAVALDNGVLGTLQRPLDSADAPVVLMLHGFGSQKDEVGNMYARLADALAERGVASFRIDFRGFGKSDGDTGSTSVDAQVEDAEAAYAYLAGLDWVDPERIGVLGFSLGGGIATVTAAKHPDWFNSMATWSSIGDMFTDFLSSLGQETFDTAAEKGVVGLDLGWRTIVLKQEFFDSLARHDLAQLIQEYPGAYLAIVGDQDFSAAYAQDFVDSSPADPKEAWIIPGGDHIFGVLGEDQTMAESVIQRTADWFAETL